MKKTRSFLLAAGISLAMAFTFSCSGDDGDGSGSTPGVSSSSEGGSSSSVSLCGTAEYAPGTEGCCGNDKYTLAEQFCHDDTVYDKCGDEEYSPLTHLCDTRDDKLYKKVTIDAQTWMAENLNYNEDGSKCYQNNDDNCEKYGRLYNWATAMDIDADYNSDLWDGSDVKHRGICPQGWHLPSNDDWDKLFKYVDEQNGGEGDGTPYDSYTAGMYLKATSGWNSSGNGTNQYGFSALPGGYGGSDGYFDDAGDGGYWWGSSEHSSYDAYYRHMYYSRESAIWISNGKSNLYSVRCLQD